ncbi:hypothetical protein VCHA56P521_210025 [Vibrio chagasii]|nr:hypothetical protein VCHA36P168_160044 [Vibrio chagasii]CAH7065953.1 hypothetical protein VCHA52P461_170057 [Vibrio chagasii]CAH7310758.1 hypothetical protein VCHA37P203_210025 [Vibrio chagasii]CAH7328620.1 hypothetical protein VCHA56P521_210025 [Vibrio chagasii]
MCRVNGLWGLKIVYRDDFMGFYDIFIFYFGILWIFYGYFN